MVVGGGEGPVWAGGRRVRWLHLDIFKVSDLWCGKAMNKHLDKLQVPKASLERAEGLKQAQRSWKCNATMPSNAHRRDFTTRLERVTLCLQRLNMPEY